MQIEHHRLRIKNPNWREGTSGLFTNVAEDLKLGQPKKSSKWREPDSNQGPPDYESDALTTHPRCLPNIQLYVHWYIA